MFRAITFELRLARDIMHGGKALARHIASRVEPRFSETLAEVRSLPKYWVALFQLALMALIGADRKAVLEAELDLREERRKEKDARELRDGTRKTLRDLLVDARSFLEGAMKRGASAALVGLDPNLVQEAIVLMRYGTEAAKVMSRPDFQPKVLVINGVVHAPQDYAEKIRKATEDLEAAEDLLASQVRETEKKLKVKERAVKKLSKENGCCARILEEIYVLAGEEFHAERLRKSSRQRPSSEVEDDPAVVDQEFEDQPLTDEDLRLAAGESQDDATQADDSAEDSASDADVHD